MEESRGTPFILLQYQIQKSCDVAQYDEVGDARNILELIVRRPIPFPSFLGL